MWYTCPKLARTKILQNFQLTLIKYFFNTKSVFTIDYLVMVNRDSVQQLKI